MVVLYIHINFKQQPAEKLLTGGVGMKLSTVFKGNIIIIIYAYYI